MTESRDLLADALADRYLLEEALGRGATATVYLAQDVRHGRRVALKVLHAALGQALGVERFQREIRTQARLHHPHILPLFDSGSAAGQLYYVMPYVETGTLRERLMRQGPLSVAAAVQLGREVASALAYAHALGVVHRDLKPENIVFSPMGHAILADFGIAYAVDSAAAGAGRRLTETGVAVGTPVYMSPEQSAGDELVDGRTDQYSLAVVLYEALTLLPPFTGPNARAIFAQKLTESPPVIRDRRPDVPPALEQVLFRALERAREARYETIEEFSTALAEAARMPSSPPAGGVAAASRALPVVSSGAGRRWRAAALVAVVLLVLASGALAARRFVTSRAAAAAAAAGPRVVAVLPFKNLGAPGDQYFADGLTEEITSRLAGLSGLRVISRTSADQYRASEQSVRTIGGELGADYVLEGSVRWARDGAGVGRLRVTPQLIRVTDDSHLWAATYDATLGEVFRLQSEIAEQVTTALDVALRAPERVALAAVGTRNPEAYDFYLRGNDYVARGTERSDVLAAIDLYQHAVALDSSFAPAFAKLARAEAAMYWFYYDHSPERLERVKRAAEAARRLAPDLAEARVALGYYYYWGHLDYERALQEFEAARRLQPSNSDVLGAIGYVERRRGRWDAAVDRFREAIEFDPVSQQRAFDLGDTYLTLRKFPEAERQLDRTIQLAPDWAKPYGYKAMLQLIWKGDRQRARAVIGQAMSRVSTGRLARALMTADAISASVISSDSIFFPASDAVRADAFEADTGAYYLFKAEAAHYRDQPTVERAYGDSARRWLEPQLQLQPDDAKRLVHYGLACARAGRPADAIRAGRRALELLPPAEDAASGPFIQTYLAQIYMLTGNLDQAVTTLRPLLTLPSWITQEELTSDPLWAPLQSHPGFAALAAGTP
jgi:TolB-like protein/Flp pilus assembly protein TadD/tRNA A-37 threonylcarbamoyl transferase component Bud32